MVWWQRPRYLGWNLVLILLGLIVVMAPEIAPTPAPRVAGSALDATIQTPQTDETPLLRLRIGDFDPLTFTPQVQGRQERTAKDNAWALRLIQFSGPIHDAWLAEMDRENLEIVAYIPDYTYLVWGTEPALKRLSSNAPVRWWGEYQALYALDPALPIEGSDPVGAVVQIYDHPGAESTLEAINKMASKVLRPAITVIGLTSLAVEVEPEQVWEIALLSDVVTVERWVIPQRHDEMQNQIMAGHLSADGSTPLGPGYLSWLTGTVGFTTTASAYPIVDVTDDGIDDGTETPQHPDFYTSGDTQLADRLAYNENWTTDPAADGAGGHGNLNASIVAGYNARSGFPYEDNDGYNYGLGVNPFGRVAGSKIFGNTSGWAGPDYTQLVARSYNLGARIISNSWGEVPGSGAYLVDDQIYDMLVRDADLLTPGAQPVTVIFSAGNSGIGANTTGSPANAKNVIAVGASENVRPTKLNGSSWIDGCGTGSSGANDATDIIGFSSRGPTDDGRVKPDLVAPGTHIQGAATQSDSYTGLYVCDAYQPSGQTLYAASSGTSHAAPAVAGAASLLYRYYQDRFDAPPPSPAMVKAYLMNAARYLDGNGAGGTLPSNSQGHGLADLGRAFDTVARVVEDQTLTFHETGATYVIGGYVAQADAPFRVTLAWSDAPGSTVGAAYVNDLDLTVSVEGQTYLGNVFDGPNATTGGSHDPRNNVESVFLPAGVTGAYTITVKATNLAGDGVPYNGDATDQDFVLVCYNCNRDPNFSLAVTPYEQTICRPDTATYTVTTTPVSSFTGWITLSASGGPPATTARFADNPIASEASTQFTLTPTLSTPTGQFTIAISGLSGSMVHTTPVKLGVLASRPLSPTLLKPVQDSSNVETNPTLVWQPTDDAARYLVAVATDPDFTDLVYTTTTAAASHTVSRTLAYKMRYYWRVTAVNVCGASPSSATYIFETHRRPVVICADANLAIPDDHPQGVTHTLYVAMGGVIQDMNVTISATHAWVGDLSFRLEHVDTGQSAMIYDRPGVPATSTTAIGCAGDNLDLGLDDDADLSVEDQCQDTIPAYPPGSVYRPNEPLQPFNGEPLAGLWRITAVDHMAADKGSLNRWCLVTTIISSTEPASVAFSQPAYTITSKTTPTQAPVTVTLGNIVARVVTVDYATVGGTAIAGKHYLTTSGTLTFPIGTTEAVFTVPVLDLPLTLTRTVTLALGKPTNASLNFSDQAVLILPAQLRQRYYIPLLINGIPLRYYIPLLIKGISEP